MEKSPVSFLKKALIKIAPKAVGIFGESTQVAQTEPVTAKRNFGQADNGFGPQYSMAKDRKLVDEVFESLRCRIYDYIDEKRHLEENGVLDFKVHREYGRLSTNKTYFYIRPFNHLGWLFERQGVGWIISLADKVSSRDLFVRKGDVWDIVSVMEAKEKNKQIMISSQRLSLEHIPMSVYVDRLVSKIGLENSHREY